MTGSPPPNVSVILPCYNGGETIRHQLGALAAQQCTDSWEVVFVNNRSTDNSVEIAKQFMGVIPDLRIIDAFDKQGQPYALNAGVHAARGDSLLLCDADDMVGSGWLQAMVSALKDHDIVAARFDIHKFNTPETIKLRGAHPQEKGVMSYDYPPYYPHVGGGSLGFRRDLYRAANGFDDAFPALHDTDFCWKAQRRGKTIHFVNDAVVHVRYRTTPAENYRQAKYYGEYNVKIYKKYKQIDMPGIHWKEGIRTWINLLKIRRLLQLRHSTQRNNYLWQLGWQLGRLKGCIKYRVLAF